MDIETINYLVQTIIGGAIGLIFYMFKKIENKLSKTYTKDETEHLIDMKQETMYVMQKESKEDIHRLEGKIDKLIDLQLKKD